MSSNLNYIDTSSSVQRVHSWHKARTSSAGNIVISIGISVLAMSSSMMTTASFVHIQRRSCRCPTIAGVKSGFGLMKCSDKKNGSMRIRKMEERLFSVSSSSPNPSKLSFSLSSSPSSWSPPSPSSSCVSRREYNSRSATEAGSSRSSKIFASNRHSMLSSSFSISSSSSLASSESPSIDISSPAENDDSNNLKMEVQYNSDGETTMSSHKLHHPDDFVSDDGKKIPFPKALSPSAIMEFKNCQQSFLFQYLYGLRQPTNKVLTKGIMVHSALESVFDFDVRDRTLLNLQNLFRKIWSDHRKSETYKHLFELSEEIDGISGDPSSWDLQGEIEWGKSCLQLLENYVQLENPQNIQHPNPVQREIWVNSMLNIDPKLGATGGYSNKFHVSHRDGTTSSSSSNQEALSSSNDESLDSIYNSTIHVRGIVDRLDMVRMKNNDNHNHHSSSSSGQDNHRGKNDDIVFRIVDYKTGASPQLKYTQKVNERIINEAFYQLKIYALLLRERNAKYDKKQTTTESNNHRESSSEFDGTDSNIPVRILRLLYLTTKQDPNRAKYYDYDLGRTQEERDLKLNEIHADITDVYKNMVSLISKQDPKLFQGCNRSFCYCHKKRSDFMPGTVWEPDP